MMSLQVQLIACFICFELLSNGCGKPNFKEVTVLANGNDSHVGDIDFHHQGAERMLRELDDGFFEKSGTPSQHRKPQRNHGSRIDADQGVSLHGKDNINVNQAIKVNSGPGFHGAAKQSIGVNTNGGNIDADQDVSFFDAVDNPKTKSKPDNITSVSDHGDAINFTSYPKDDRSSQGVYHGSAGKHYSTTDQEVSVEPKNLEVSVEPNNLEAGKNSQSESKNLTLDVGQAVASDLKNGMLNVSQIGSLFGEQLLDSFNIIINQTISIVKRKHDHAASKNVTTNFLFDVSKLLAKFGDSVGPNCFQRTTCKVGAKEDEFEVAGKSVSTFYRLVISLAPDHVSDIGVRSFHFGQYHQEEHLCGKKYLGCTESDQYLKNSLSHLHA